MTKPRWLIEDKEFWIDCFMTLLPSMMAEVPNYDEDDKLIPITDWEQIATERVGVVARATDGALKEMQFRFWDNEKGEPAVRFEGRGNTRGKSGRRKRARKGGT